VREGRHVSVLSNMISLATTILCSHPCSLCLLSHDSQVRSRVWRKSIGRGPGEHSLASAGSFRSWKRVEYVINRVDKLMLVEYGAVIDPGEDESRSCN
jgi:hypothetical protein